MNLSQYGIIGHPVKHSLSPVMHNTAFHALEVDAEYKVFEVSPENLSEFLQELKDPASPIFGLNVTVPYKQDVIPFMDSLNPFADKVKAVNTIVIDEKRRLHGYNTDGPGFLAHLAELGVETKDKRIAILGAGGTTRAILTVLGLIPEKPESIKLYNRTTSKAVDLVQDLSKRIDLHMVEVVETQDDLNIELADILINTTSVGLKNFDPCVIDPELLHGNLFVYDVIYNPYETTLLKEAKARGAQVTNGLGMLFYQGVLAFQHWAGMDLDEAIKLEMRQALEEACGL